MIGIVPASPCSIRWPTRSFHPWALNAPDGPFHPSGLIVLLAAAVIDIRVWMSLAYPAYGVRACCCWWRWMVVGHVGLGAQRWISLGSAGICNRPS